MSPAALPCLIQQHASLRRYNTFGVEAKARWLVRLQLPDALPEILAREEFRDLPMLVLGDGSNVLFRHDYEGVVVKLDAQRAEQLEADDDSIVIRVECGHNWHKFVLWTLERNLGGLENLALIPGTVGAAPIQNIGAYGVELERYVDRVETFDRNTASFVNFDRAACEFGYRSSVFKHPDLQSRYIITAVRFRFPFDAQLTLDYPGVREELAAMGVDQPGASEVCEAICRIRRRKLPDPAVLGNAGSFFKNPLVDERQAQALLRAFPQMPQFPTRGGKVKLAAGWLIERLGLRGFRSGDAAVADTHALVLVNHGQASGEQIWALAQKIRGLAFQTYGIELEPEPMIV
jgi:UDP-N-acetylmuramate dehydrogenase